MTEIKVTLTGTTALLHHKFSDAAQEEATNGTRASAVGNRGTPREQAEMVLHTGVKGKPMIPADALFQCIIAAGTFFKMGKGKVSTQKSSIIPACLEIREIELPIKFEKPWEVDRRAVRIPATGGRIIRYRPRFDDWQVTAIMILDESMMKADFLREIVDAAGNRIGLLDYRPACRGPFGKFRIDHWDAKESKI